MANCVAVDLQQIIEGRTLSFPIHDPRGILLLSAGTVFTAAHRQRLVERGVTRVIMNAVDAANSTTATVREASEPELQRLDGKLNERLDTLIRSGMLTVQNIGQALLSSVARHGARRCDPKTQQQLLEQHAAGSEKVDKFMKSASIGSESNGSEMGGVADTCVDSLVADIDSSLGVCGLKNQDPTLSDHAINVAMIGIAIGIDMGMDVKNVRTIGISGLMQDLGMVKVPERIRNARRRLTPTECVDIQRHAIHTANNLEHVVGIPPLVQLVAYQVHERPDGSGYPRRREKKCIHLFARILHVADAYLAMTAQRPFRPPLMPYAAMECLLRQAEKNRVDPDVVRSLLKVLSLFPVGSFVRLSDGSEAQVLRANAHSFSRPVVALVRDSSGKPVAKEDDSAIINLSGSELSVSQALPAPGSTQIPLTPEIADWSVRVARLLSEEEQQKRDVRAPISRLVPAS